MSPIVAHSVASLHAWASAEIFPGGESRLFAYLFQFAGDARQMDVHKKNVHCYGNSCVQCFPCKKTLQLANVLVSMDFLRLS